MKRFLLPKTTTSVFAWTIAALLVAAPTTAWADDTNPPGSANAAAPAAPEEKKGETPAAATAAADQKGVFLHVATPEPVRIENSENGEVVCTSPCDKQVPASSRYRIGGARPSPNFSLAPKNDRADVRVNPGSNGSFWAGVGVLGFGVAGIATGASILVYGLANRAPVQGADGDGTTDNSFTDYMALGSVVTLVGTVAAIWGTASIINNASTKVRGDLNTANNSDHASPATSPTKRATSNVGVAVPKPTMVPVFSGTF